MTDTFRRTDLDQKCSFNVHYDKYSSETPDYLPFPVFSKSLSKMVSQSVFNFTLLTTTKELSSQSNDRLKDHSTLSALLLNSNTTGNIVTINNSTFPPLFKTPLNDEPTYTGSTQGLIFEEILEDPWVSSTNISESDQKLADIGHRLILFYCPFLVLFGTVGNALSIMVFSRQSFRQSPLSVYTRFMAFNDLAALYTGPVYYYLNSCCGIDLNLKHDIICRTYKFRVFLFTDVSAYTILSLTTERLFSVVLPLKVKIFCSKSRSYFVIAATFLLIALANSPLVFWSHIVTKMDSTNSTISTCVFDPEPALEQIWFAFDIAKFWVIPVSFITVSNIILLFQLYGYHRYSIFCFRTGQSELENDVAEVSRRANNHKQKSMTLMLIFVSVVFLVCNLPVVLFPVELVILPTQAAQDLATIVSDLLMFTNNTLNFLLYCACGSRFRRELIAMLCFRRTGSLKGRSSSSEA